MGQVAFWGGALGAFALVVCACAAEGTPSSSAKNDPASASATGGAGGGASTAPADAPKREATLRVHLVDAPAEEVKAVFVTIAKVEASIGGEWLTVSEEERTVDLLTLQDGAFLDLGSANLPAGHVDQMRLRLAPDGDHHVVTPDDASHPLEIPSGEQSGIKLAPGFDLAPCSTTELTIDFDGKKSVSVGANSQGWRLRPVVMIKALESTGSCQASSEAVDAGAADAQDDAASP